MGTVTYWNQLAAGFDDQVLQISQCDIHGVIQATARRLRGRDKLAIDFGCGPGAVTRMISPYFGDTLGVDFATQLLTEARRLSEGLDIRYERRDLRRPPDPAWPRADVGFCANVLIHESDSVRRRMADHICSSVRSGGHLVVVVPSYESALRTYQTLSRCHQRDGRSAAQARSTLDRQAGSEILSMTDGIINVGGTPTKHFLQDEIAQLLNDHGIEVEQIERVEFPWAEEIDHPPSWLVSPGPWDWLVRGPVRPGRTARGAQAIE
ncbi:MAG: class I SAM-dependent methyltransferase [Gemmatimonadetes bacterium]|jgi:SAM-dependent methyltransferase|nr:class I SAM-dependent methyltransferase [Gemmatimonadota bacterium]MBT7859873.1 class I SAM-dependent methyltransferase [Gemmatimonadota bacterium]